MVVQVKHLNTASRVQLRDNQPRTIIPTVVDTAALARSVIFSRSRRTIPGPEANLVTEFLNSYRLKVPRQCSAIIFVEPRIGHCFPDLVVAVVHLPTLRRWPKERSRLSIQDIRLAQLLHSLGRTTTERLRHLYGRPIIHTLTRLEESGIARCKGDFWRLSPVSEVFAVRRLLAFEAKTSPSRHALSQARGNLWFASSSSLLVRSEPRSSAVMREAAECGVGIVISKGARVVQRAAVSNARQPASLGSWLFNEWSSHVFGRGKNA